VLRTWAEANREGTYKRLLAAFLFLVVLFVLANANFMSAAVDRVLAWMGHVLGGLMRPASMSLSIVLVGEWTAFFLVVTVLMVPIFLIVNLLANLTVQGLILEACIVAGHASEQSSKAQASVEKGL
jgi:hypothetical protein